jgi:hypothetical protein
MNLKEYYPYYLSLHKNKKCRLLHFLGQISTLIFAAFIFINWYWYLIPLIPFVIYPFAWSGHYFFEKNTPAAFKDPYKAKLSDWMMFKDILLGKIKIW